MAEVKPCPFCGRTPTVDDCGDHRYFVRCKCGIAQDKLYAQKCDAVRRWNTRKTGEIAKDTNVPSNDCISRAAAIEELIAMREHIDASMSVIGCTAYEMAIEALREPEIIRCKDCRKNPKWEWVGCPMTGKDTRKPDDFCSYAERKSNG